MTLQIVGPLVVLVVQQVLHSLERGKWVDLLSLVHTTHAEDAKEVRGQIGELLERVQRPERPIVKADPRFVPPSLVPTDLPELAKVGQAFVDEVEKVGTVEEGAR